VSRTYILPSCCLRWVVNPTYRNPCCAYPSVVKHSLPIHDKMSVSMVIDGVRQNVVFCDKDLLFASDITVSNRSSDAHSFVKSHIGVICLSKFKLRLIAIVPSPLPTNSSLSFLHMFHARSSRCRTKQCRITRSEPCLPTSVVVVTISLRNTRTQNSTTRRETSHKIHPQRLQLVSSIFYPHSINITMKNSIGLLLAFLTLTTARRSSCQTTTTPPTTGKFQMYYHLCLFSVLFYA
jgi:hypothetical protein